MTKIQRRLGERIDASPHGLAFDDAQRVLRKMLWLADARPTWNFCTNGYPQLRLVHEAAQRALLVSAFAEVFTFDTREGPLEHLRLTASGRSLALFLGPLPMTLRDYYRAL